MCSLSNVDRKGDTEVQRLRHVCIHNFVSFTIYYLSFGYVLHESVIACHVQQHESAYSGWNLSPDARDRHTGISYWISYWKFNRESLYGVPVGDPYRESLYGVPVWDPLCCGCVFCQSMCN